MKQNAKRIQRKRIKGWRMPENTVYVGRGSKWGNPHKSGEINGSPHLLDITFRMLQPHELAQAQGFPASYIFTGNKSEQVRQIGNAVCPPIAEALAMEAFVA